MTFKHNDGGRAASGFKGSTGDCGVRAAALVTGLPYRDVYDELFRLQSEYHNGLTKGGHKRWMDKNGASPRKGLYRPVMDKFMTAHGFKWVATRAIGQPPTLVRDIKARYPSGCLVMRLGRHFSALMDGVNVDTWEQVDAKTVYGVWVAA